MSPSLTLHRADEAGALDYVERLLSRADLPTADVREQAGAFRVATVAGERVGVGGVERHGRDGLVRSVVVEPSARGQGVGAALVAALATLPPTLVVLDTLEDRVRAAIGRSGAGADPAP